MIQIFFDRPKIVLENKKKLEKELEVKIAVKYKEVEINGLPEDEFIAEKVILALNFGFPVEKALQIKKEEDRIFEIISIKDFTKKADMERIRGRIIGTKGKTLRTITELTKCDFELKGNQIAIIGNADTIKYGQQAVVSIIQGTKQANVYAYLEKHHPIPVIDLGLKKPKRKRARKVKRAEE